MKLTSSEIKKVVIEKATSYLLSDSAYPEEKQQIQNPNNWKRWHKSKLGVLGITENYYAGEGYEKGEVLEMFEWSQSGGILDPQELCNDCICRIFGNADLTAECLVISDPKDKRILQILWHVD